MFELYHRCSDLKLFSCNIYMEKVNDKKIGKLIEKGSNYMILLGQANQFG